MAFNITCSKLTGNPGKSGWVQVHEFKPEDPEKLIQRGHLFAVIATKYIDEEIESVAMGRELLARIHEEYFGDITISAFNALKEACEKVVSEFSKSWGDIQIVAVAIVDKVVYSAAGGGAQLTIFRDGMLATILESKKTEGKIGIADIATASGYPEEEDLLVLGTDSFYSLFPPGSLKAALESKDPESSVEFLAPTAHSGSDKGDLGAAILKFKESRREEVDVITKDETAGERAKPDILKRSRVVENIKSKAVNLGRLIKGKVRSRLPERRIYVKEGTIEMDTVQNRKLAVSVGVILLILLIVSIIFGIRQKKTKEEVDRYEPALEQAKHEYDESIDLYTLDVERSRELFLESKKKVESLKNEGIEDERLTQLINDIEQNQGKILGEYYNEPELFVDLSLLSDGFQATSLKESDENLFVFDRDGERIVRVNISTKRSEVVAGPDQIDSAKDIAVFVDNVYVLEDDAVVKVGEEKESVIDADWSGEVLINSYSGNIYVLEKGAGKIWRYPGIEEGFASGSNWFSEGVEPDLTKINSWTIDGTMWLLNNSGRIIRYSLGNQVAFEVQQVEFGLEKTKDIFTNEEQEYLYLLDSENERVVVITKEGEYKAQYKNSNIKNAEEIVVSEKEGRLILLSENKLFSIDLKHL